MSLGFAGVCHLEAEDEHTAIYSYRGENWNLDKAVAAEAEKIEGMFTIDKACLVEPEIHSRVRKMPNGRKKLVEKVIPVFVPVMELASEGSIQVDRLCGVDELSLDDSFARLRIIRNLLHHVFESYQLNGRLPEKEGFIQ